MEGWKFEWDRYVRMNYNERCSCGECGGRSANTCKCARKRFKRAWKHKHNVPKLSERVKILEERVKMLEDAVLKK